MAVARLVPTVPVAQDVELVLTQDEAADLRMLIACNPPDTTSGFSVRGALESVGVTYDAVVRSRTARNLPRRVN